MTGGRAGLLAAFDAGQTHTTCRIAAAASPLAALGQGEGSGVRHLAAPDGAACFRAGLLESLAAARRTLPRDVGDLSLRAAVVGASGIETGSGVQRQGLRLAAETLALPPERILVTGDERTALHGAFPDRPGIVLISGTGMICIGRDRQGREARCGGWGWLLDGAGSAMDLGQQALAVSLRMADGRLARTDLQRRLWQRLGVRTPEEVKALVVGSGFGPARFAALAPEVEALAGTGDPHALEVIEHSARALAEAAEGVAQRLGLAEAELCGMGGAIEHLPTLRASTRQALERRRTRFLWTDPDGDACSGALRLATTLLPA
jgi:phenylacetic acid degradation operon negative regulatory protein